MQNDLPALHDVVIAGGGPVGLFLACELRLAGVSALVLERSETPDSPLKTAPFGLRGLSAPTIEAFYRRGLLDDIAAAGSPVGTAARSRRHRPGGHFAGLPFSEDDVETSRWRYRLPGPAGTTMAVTMEALERIFEARATMLGVAIRRGLGVEGFASSSEEVEVHAGGKSFRGRWLVGCDGGRSTVRKLAGFDFAGTDPEMTGYSVAVELADPESLPAGRHYTPSGMFMFTPPGTIAMVEFDAGAFHRTQPVTREHVQAVLRRVSGRDVGVTSLRYATTWTDRACQATAYREGRVLLAGDAAHIHSPLGGQGLNLGLGDALNLGWKLAAIIRGDAPTDLLDTYWSERAPIGARVLDWSRAQVALMRPSASSRALASIVGDLLQTRDGATYFADRIWAVSLRYDLGGIHPLVGRSVPDFELVDGTRIGALLREGRGILLDFEGHASLATLASRWNGRIRYRRTDVADRLGLRAVLVRPDGHVAWACDDAPDVEDAFAAAARWFGRPENGGGLSAPAPYGSSNASTT